MAQWLRSSPCTPWDPIWAPVLILAAPLPIQLPACGLGKQSRTAQSFGNLHPRGRPRRGSWLGIGIESAVALTWGVNHRTEDLPLCLSSLYIRLSNKKNNKNKSLKKFFLRFISFYWKVRYTERRRDREEDLPSDGSLPK